MQLEGISGNPDIYLRTVQVPTASHSSNGITETTFERSLTSGTTEYGNFVPLNGKTEVRSATGHLVSRRPGGGQCECALSPQTFHRFHSRPCVERRLGERPARRRLGLALLSRADSADRPTNWQITFSQISGDVVMHLRDTIPPGNGINTNTAEHKDWISDAKNNGPYAIYDLPGTYTFTVPPVRPNSVYYLGIRAKNDSTFSLSSIVVGGDNDAPPVIPFYGGSVTNTIPPNSQVAYRILTPSDALRWRHTSIHSNTVSVYIENGSFPYKSTLDDFRSTAANSAQDRYVNGYPWLPDQTYYLIATNTTAVAQLFNFNMNGSSIQRTTTPTACWTSGKSSISVRSRSCPARTSTWTGYRTSTSSEKARIRRTRIRFSHT